MDAIERGEQLMMEMENRYVSVYDAALRKAVRSIRVFLRKVKDVQSGKIKPPQYYVDRDEVDKWREGFLKELARKLQVVENIASELNAAGGQAAEIIRDGLDEVYAVNRAEAVDTITVAAEANRFAVQPSFAMMDKRSIRIAIEDAEPVFSKIAYKNLGNNVAVRRRLQNTLAEAIALGEDQEMIMRRIRKITLQTTKQARRVAQTELTRVRSQARYEAGQEATQQGVGVYNTWSTRMVNSRDTHIMLNGKKAMQGERFPGSVLRYPGDPTAPAREVINCHCVLVPDVLLPGESLDADGNVIERHTGYDTMFGIGRSVGAKARNYDVVDKRSGKVYHFVEGTKIQNAQTFAGFGGVKPLRPETIEGLCREFGGDPQKWSHRKGTGYLDINGEEVKAEVHWFQEATVGKVKFKVKEFIDDD